MYGSPLLTPFAFIAHHEATRHPAAPKDASYPLKAGTAVKAAPSSSSKPATQGPNGTSRHVLDFTELPARYRHPQLTEAEIEAVEVKKKRTEKEEGNYYHHLEGMQGQDRTTEGEFQKEDLQEQRRCHCELTKIRSRT